MKRTGKREMDVGLEIPAKAVLMEGLRGNSEREETSFRSGRGEEVPKNTYCTSRQPAGKQGDHSEVRVEAVEWVLGWENLEQAWG